jgi:hypothetical protein
MIGMSRGDEEIIDDALDMLVWQRKRIEVLEAEIARMREALVKVMHYGDRAAVEVARAALAQETQP